jgi:hypothetical protein
MTLGADIHHIDLSIPMESRLAFGFTGCAFYLQKPKAQLALNRISRSLRF